MPVRSQSPQRVSFANIDEALPLPDLISILRSRLHGAETSLDILVNGESYNLNRTAY